MNTDIATRQGSGVAVRTVKGVGIGSAVVVGGLVAIHVVGMILSVLSFVFPVAVLGSFAYVLYKLFFER